VWAARPVCSEDRPASEGRPYLERNCGHGVVPIPVTRRSSPKRFLVEKCGGAHFRVDLLLAGVGRIPERVRTFAVAQAVGKGEASIVISAQAHFCGWVIIRHFFWRELIERASCEKRFRSHLACDERSSDANGYAVQKVTPGDLPAHPQLFIFARFVIPGLYSCVLDR
jgi:hypothetical protein